MNIPEMTQADLAEIAFNLGVVLAADAHKVLMHAIAARDAQWNALIAGREPVGYVCPSRLADLKAGRCTAINLVNKEEAQLLDLPGHGYPDIPLYAAPVAQPATTPMDALLEECGLEVGKLQGGTTEQAEAPSEGCCHGIAGYCTKCNESNPLADYHRANFEYANNGWEECKHECDRLRDLLATQPTASNAGERERFEALFHRFDLRPSVTRVGHYNDLRVEFMWEAWQARAALASKPPQWEQKPVTLYIVTFGPSIEFVKPAEYSAFVANCPYRGEAGPKIVATVPDMPRWAFVKRTDVPRPAEEEWQGVSTSSALELLANMHLGHAQWDIEWVYTAPHPEPVAPAARDRAAKLWETLKILGVQNEKFALQAIEATLSATPPAQAVKDSRKSLNALIADQLRPFLKPGEKVIWREAFRWHDDDGVLSNHYDSMSVSNLADDFGYEFDWELNMNHAAIIRAARTRGNGVEPS